MFKKNKLTVISAEVGEVYNLFKKQPYSEHIATPVSLEAILTILKKEKPLRVLEVGGGIGTISMLVLKNTNAHLDVFEDYDKCIDALTKNVGEFKDRYTLVTTYDGFEAPQSSYDLIIVDGGTKEFLKRMVQGLENIKTIYVDGNRQEQRDVMYGELAKNYVFKHLHYMDSARKYKGGFKITCHPSKNTFLKTLSFYQLRGANKLGLKTRNFLRKITGKKDLFTDYVK